jgi:Predicted hydrolase (metallo-beta-lactamase superfamily)
VATIALLPLTLLFFQQIAVLSPLANALAIPVVTLVVAPLAVGGLLLPAPLDGWVWRLAAWVQQGLDAVLHQMADWPLAQWHAAAPDGLTLALAALGVLALALPWNWRLRAPGLLLLLPLASNPGTAPETGAMEVWFADVGQGMAVVVRTARHTLLYDTGPRQAPGVDAGGRVLLPLLHSLGVRRLDRVVVSHDDSDHAGGAATLARAHPEADLLTSAPPDAAARYGLQQRQPCTAGQHWAGTAWTSASSAPARRRPQQRQRPLLRAACGRARRLGAAHRRRRSAAGARPAARRSAALCRRAAGAASRQQDVVERGPARHGDAARRRGAGGLPQSARPPPPRRAGALRRARHRRLAHRPAGRAAVARHAPDTFIAWRVAKPHYWSANVKPAEVSR